MTLYRERPRTIEVTKITSAEHAHQLLAPGEPQPADPGEWAVLCVTSVGEELLYAGKVGDYIAPQLGRGNEPLFHLFAEDTFDATWEPMPEATT